MAVYKVAQDVEADDKLLGPFSFRQFVYLIVVAISLGLAWGLSQLFIALAIIPLPITILFGALALPLRKDQPMEVYLAAVVSYYIKPRKRLWTPDGIESLVEITAPKVVEIQRAKDITQLEAEKRLSYLANIADTEGWAIRHAAKPFNESPLVSDVYNDAQRAEDMLDTDGNVSRSLDMMLDQSDERHRQEVVARMHQASASPPETQTDTHIAPTQHTSEQSTHQPSQSPQFNPYPTIRQSVIQPLTPGGQAPVDPSIKPSQEASLPQTQQINSLASDNQPSSTSKKAVSPDIINLANNPDLSIETIQREANRIQEKEDESEGEVFISLH